MAQPQAVCVCVCVWEVLFTFKHTHSVHTDRMIQPQIGQSTQSLLLFLPMFCKKMLCSISSFTKWRPQFIEIQLVLVSEVMALPAHAHMDTRLSIKKVSLLGFYVFNSRILCTYPYTFLALSLLHVGEMISTVREFSIACFGLKTMPSVWYPMGSASCWCSCIERETFDITDYERDTWRKNSDFTNIECYLNVS